MVHIGIGVVFILLIRAHCHEYTNSTTSTKVMHSDIWERMGRGREVGGEMGGATVCTLTPCLASFCVCLLGIGGAPGSGIVLTSSTLW